MKSSMNSRLIARSLSLLWAGWWIFFAMASWAGEGGHLNQLVIPAAVSLALAGSAGIAWKWEFVGGALLALEGLVLIAGYPLIVNERFSLATVLFVIGTLGLPPLTAGLLFMYTARSYQKPHPA
jgi:glutathione S-transferase